MRGNHSFSAFCAYAVSSKHVFPQIVRNFVFDKIGISWFLNDTNVSLKWRSASFIWLKETDEISHRRPMHMLEHLRGYLPSRVHRGWNWSGFHKSIIFQLSYLYYCWKWIKHRHLLTCGHVFWWPFANNLELDQTPYFIEFQSLCQI